MMNSQTEPQLSFLLCGLVRNCESTIEQDLLRLRRAFSGLGKLQFVLVESDSSDNTVEKASLLASVSGDIELITLGKLTERFPDRVERLTFCRNRYLERLLELQESHFLVVADMDNVNSMLGTEPLDRKIFEGNFSALFANQDGPYYDLYALRHELWCPSNVFEERSQLMEFGLSEREAGVVSVVSKMIKIPRDSPPIPVRSAFGGLAIYRVSDIPKDARYSAIGKNGRQVCEHVPFNEAIADSGGTLFILPSLINAKTTEHTRGVSGVRMLIRWAIWPIRTLFGARQNISVI